MNFLAPYPGWKDASSWIADAWTKASAVVAPNSIVTTALRYINLIPAALNEAPGQWLTANRYIPQAVLDAPSGFYRVDLRNDAGLRILLTMMRGMVGSNAGPQEAGLILDIECSSDARLTPDLDRLSKVLDALHDHCWDVFNAGMTERLQDYMREGK